MHPQLAEIIGERDIYLALYLIKVSAGSSRRIIKALKKIHNKKIIKLSFEVKRVICQCNILLIPGITCISKVSKSTDGTYLYKTCTLCSHSSKMRISAKRF